MFLIDDESTSLRLCISKLIKSLNDNHISRVQLREFFCLLTMLSFITYANMEAMDFHVDPAILINLRSQIILLSSFYH